MAAAYTIDEVLTEMYACCDHSGDSSMRNKDASEFLGKYQNSSMAWSISNKLLCSMGQPEEVLGLAVVTLRHKIRYFLSELHPQNHLELFYRSIMYLKYATSNGMQQLMRHLSVAVADLMLRMQIQQIVSVCISRLSVESLPALFLLLEVLPTEAVALKELPQLLNDTQNLHDFLQFVHNRLDMDLVSLHRGCFLICASWTRANLLPLERLMEHRVVYNAFYILAEPNTFELSQEASDFLIAILEHVLHLQQTQSLNHELSEKIFFSYRSIALPDSPLAVQKRKDIAQLYIQIADTYAGLNVMDAPSALLERGPICFELLLKVAYQCGTDVLISSMPMWHKLFDNLPFRFEHELCGLFGQIVLSALDIFFRHCRLPDAILIHGSPDYETMLELRGHVADMLPSIGNLEEMITLTNFLDHLLKTVIDPNSYWSDVEASLFFMTPLIPQLLRNHRHVLTHMMATLPMHLNETQLHPAIREQIITLNTQCHKCIDNKLQRHQFIEQLISLRAFLGLWNDSSLLEVIVKSCSVLYHCRTDDLLMYQEQFCKLADQLTNLPTNPKIA